MEADGELDSEEEDEDFDERAAAAAAAAEEAEEEAEDAEDELLDEELPVRRPGWACACMAAALTPAQHWPRPWLHAGVCGERACPGPAFASFSWRGRARCKGCGPARVRERVFGAVPMGDTAPGSQWTEGKCTARAKALSHVAREPLMVPGYISASRRSAMQPTLACQSVRRCAQLGRTHLGMRLWLWGRRMMDIASVCPNFWAWNMGTCRRRRAHAGPVGDSSPHPLQAGYYVFVALTAKVAYTACPGTWLPSAAAILHFGWAHGQAPGLRIFGGPGLARALFPAATLAAILPWRCNFVTQVVLRTVWADRRAWDAP